MPSHALLLRLFLSPSFFSVHVALRYLNLYADNIGITYYLTRRLRELDTQELRDVWGFICHLLLTSPTKSRALECFVVDVAQRSSHIAMITLWFMQAALKDLSSARHDSQSFVICQRVLHRCHEIIFSDLPASTTPYASLSVPFRWKSSRRKIRPHAEPVLIGIGIMLAGIPGLPRLTEAMGEVIIEQGRIDEDGHELKSLEPDSDETGLPQIPAQPEQPDAEDESGDDEELQNDQPGTNVTPQGEQSVRKPGGLTRRRTIGAAQTVPALPIYLREIRRSRASEDPLGQLDSEHITAPYQSSPSVSAAPLAANPKVGDAFLAQFDHEFQTQFLRSHFCRSEVQFLLTLENISNRLLIVPRPARVSALRAELTALNHKLPAEVCIPLWCSFPDTPPTSHNAPTAHHRVVRIPPGESVVLNSAERAPYLLLVEILHDDLDFDPSKRGNREILKKILSTNPEQTGASRDMISFEPSSHIRRHQLKSQSVNGSDVAQLEGRQSMNSLHLFSTPSSAQAPVVPPGEDEEIDLVEQLYGGSESLHARAVDLSESIVLPPVPKNRELDMATWSSTPGSLTPSISSHLLPAQPGTTPNASPSLYNGASPVLSLDDYSERMRTAAIMLSQLNSNLLREPVMSSGVKPSPDTPRGWFSSSSPAGDPAENSRSPNSFPTSPDLQLPSSGRLRVQYSEATAIRDRIMKEMLALEEERMQHMRENRDSETFFRATDTSGTLKSAEDEGIIRRELEKADPSAVVFSESWATKKSRIQHSSPYGHLANWDCISVIVKTGGDLRQEQLAVQLIQEFQRIWEEEKCLCWVKYFRILITGGTAVSIHSIKKAEYARRLAEGRLGHVTLLDHFKATYGDPQSAKFVRAQRNFAKSLAGYSVVTYLLQIKDRHNGNILLDRDGHLIHIDFGFILSNTPGNIGFEAAPFKLPPEYIEVLGGVDGPSFLEFRKLFKEGFEASRKHCDRIISKSSAAEIKLITWLNIHKALVELMQKGN
ncbi:hypothetical protein BD779DRAFT_1502166 [Infundibulicybe gibba]|nr:hypothetical protein BD779DRAFT_1502166 [Infundibulicybe gibba]